MTKIVLIRPGATEWDEQRRIQGMLDMPLSPLGADEVSNLIEQLQELKLDVMYCADCEPTQETARAVAAALNVKLKKLENMQDVDPGLWQGMLVEEVKRKQPTVYRQWQEQPESMCPPQGESLASARKRVGATLNKLLRRHADDVIGLVVPCTLAGLVKTHFGRKQIDLWQAGAEHGRWEIIEVEPAIAGTSGHA